MQTLVAKACDGCGAGYYPKSGSGRCGAPSRWCSRRCQARTLYRQKIAPILAAGFDCPTCKTRFYPTRKTKYCSRRCAVRAAKIHTHECEWCRAEFKSTEANAATCSRKCQTSKRDATAPERQSRCRVCDAEFTYRASGRRVLYCSMKCREVKRRKKRNQYLNAAGRLRQQRLAENGVEVIDPVVVFERDGWACRLCGDPVLRDCHYLHPLAATIDHAIPVSKGGPHTMANVQCAHRVCNERKNDKVA